MPEAAQYAGVSRALLYRLLKDGVIKSVLLKRRPDSQSGVRLVDVASIDSYCAQFTAEMGVTNVQRAKQEVA